MELLASDQTFQIKVAAISSGVVIGAIAAGKGSMLTKILNSGTKPGVRLSTREIHKGLCNNY